MDYKNWRRRFFYKMALIGAVTTAPLLASTVFFILVYANRDIRFAENERLGIRFLLPLDELLRLLPEHRELSTRAQEGDQPAAARLPAKETEINGVVDQLGALEKQWGRTLQFTVEDEARHRRGPVNPADIRKEWEALRDTGRQASGPARNAQYAHLVSGVRTMIEHVGDASNLILDTDLDSYYLMDAVVLVLPMTQDRLSTLAAPGSPQPSNRPPAAADRIRQAVIASQLRETGLDRVVRDVQLALSENLNFHGISEGLQRNLPPAARTYTDALAALLPLIDQGGEAGGPEVAPDQLAAAIDRARDASFKLWQVGATELDALLANRVRVYRVNRMWGIGFIALALISSTTVIISIGRNITARMRMEQHLAQTQKLDTVGRLAAGVAHDFNNLLTVVTCHIAVLREDERLSASSRETLDSISKTTLLAAGLTRQMLLFCREEPFFNKKSLYLTDLARETLPVLQCIVPPGIQMKFSAPADAPDQPIFADQWMLQQVLLNLVKNACDAMPAGGLLEISISTREIDAAHVRHAPQARPGTHVALAVKDSGVGIPKGTLPHIFTPFFTTKAVGKGTGLGLATVFEVAQKHSGWVEVDSEVGRGTVFTVFLPVMQGEVEKPPAFVLAPADAPKGSILIVDDNPEVRAMLVGLVRRQGFVVLESSCAEAGFHQWDEQQDSIKLLLTDTVMPGMNGVEFATRLISEKPALKVIILSGYEAGMVSQSLMQKHGFRFVSKPFDPERLAGLITELVAGPAGDGPGRENAGV